MYSESLIQMIRTCLRSLGLRVVDVADFPYGEKSPNRSLIEITARTKQPVAVVFNVSVVFDHEEQRPGLFQIHAAGAFTNRRIAEMRKRWPGHCPTRMHKGVQTFTSGEPIYSKADESPRPYAERVLSEMALFFEDILRLQAYMQQTPSRILIMDGGIPHHTPIYNQVYAAVGQDASATALVFTRRIASKFPPGFFIQEQTGLRTIGKIPKGLVGELLAAWP